MPPHQQTSDATTPKSHCNAEHSIGVNCVAPWGYYEKGIENTLKEPLWQVLKEKTKIIDKHKS